MPFYRLAISLFLLCFGSSLWAQTNNLYVVDLILFLHQPLQAEQEHWPKNIDISTKQPMALLVNNPLQEIFPNSNDASQDYSKYFLPKLPESYSQLKETAATISRLQRYHSIKHITFAQRITSKNKAPHIVIQQQFEHDGKKYRLGGSIMLSVSRYLHLHSNLWLAEFSSNSEQEASNNSFEGLPATPSEQQLLTQTQASPELEQQAQWPALPAMIQASFASEAKQYLQQTARVEEASEQANVNFISTLVQHRKMRSSERHYIDHPLFGMIIQITPLATVLEQP